MPLKRSGFTVDSVGRLFAGVMTYVLLLGLIGIPGYDLSAQEHAPPLAGNESFTFFVSPQGNDGWSGTLPEPVPTGKDGPFLTLNRARDSLRKLRSKTGRGEGGTVYVRGGTYYLCSTFHLGSEDSGTRDRPFRLLAYGNEQPVLSGAYPVQPIRPSQGRILRADLSGTPLRHFSQLFIDGERQTLARMPDFDPNDPRGGGFLYAGTPEHHSKRTFRLPKGCRPGASLLKGAQVVIFPRYNYWNDILTVAEVGTESDTVTLAGDASYDIRPGDRFYFQNFAGALDAPGEWHFDKDSKQLHFWPTHEGRKHLVTVSRLDSVIEIGGAKSSLSPEHIVIQGFRIEGCEGTAIRANEARNCIIAKNTIRNCGGAGIEIDRGQAVGAVSNEIYQVGTEGISVLGGDPASLSSSQLYVVSNHVYEVGVIYKYAAGIKCRGVGNLISHNLIHDVPRMGINFGGSNNRIEYNHVYNTNKETQDSGGIHVCTRDWAQRNNVVQFNYIHDTGGYGRAPGSEEWLSPYETYGIYLDDFTSGTVVYGNVIRDTARAGIFVHGGLDNLIQNNILINGGKEQFCCTRIPKNNPLMVDMIQKLRQAQIREGAESIDYDAVASLPGNRFLGNIIYYTGVDSLLYYTSEASSLAVQFDRNIIYHEGLPLLVPSTRVPGPLQWSSWKAMGFDPHSLVADPLFLAPDRENYNVRNESPARELGFISIPFDRIGLCREHLTALTADEIFMDSNCLK